MTLILKISLQIYVNHEHSIWLRLVIFFEYNPEIYLGRLKTLAVLNTLSDSKIQNSRSTPLRETTSIPTPLTWESHPGDKRDVYISYQYPNHHTSRKCHCSKNCKYGPRIDDGRTHHFFIETQLLLTLPLNNCETWHLNYSHKPTFSWWFGAIEVFYYWKFYIRNLCQYCSIYLCFPSIFIVFTDATRVYDQRLDERCQRTFAMMFV